MNIERTISDLRSAYPDGVKKVEELYGNEVYIWTAPDFFERLCGYFHKELKAPVCLMFAADRRVETGGFDIFCCFTSVSLKKWVFICVNTGKNGFSFPSLSQKMYSAVLFEREIMEMFGVKASGNPDRRSLRLHEEVWPEGYFPLRKDFSAPFSLADGSVGYNFARGEGEGVFEVPVGPVHAGIIGPGHFRFSVAGEPIINLEIRLGFTHRGVEKMFEGRTGDAVKISECVSGDSVIAHSTAFCAALEKIAGTEVSLRARYIRAVCLELERMYNHVNDIGGIAVDVGFSFPAAQAVAIKESIQSLNSELTSHRFLKGVNCAGGVLQDLDDAKLRLILSFLKTIESDFERLVAVLESSVSFMDRVDTTGALKRKTALDLGVKGLAARACGIQEDIRSFTDEIYEIAGFKPAVENSGDVLARFRVRIKEFRESVRLIREFARNMPLSGKLRVDTVLKKGVALGYSEGWRGPVYYWISVDAKGVIDRCKIVDPSFLNWQGLGYCVLGDIIPDFPVCNKSFDLSYSGTDL